MTKIDWLELAKEALNSSKFHACEKCINEVIELIKLDSVQEDYMGKSVSEDSY